MLFPTVEFAIYFPVVLALSWALMPHLQWWKIFIVVASYVFYGTANWKFCFLLGGVTLGNHLFARLILRTPDQRRKKQLVGTAVALDLATLGVFKYYAFFVEDVDRVFDSTGLGLPFPLLTIALPVGISFFTFQAITYVVDTYRGHAQPAPLLDVAVYLSFFSHLVAGPIVRASEFLPQIEKPRDPANVAVGAGLFLIAVGLVKKVAIADYLAREVVDPVFAVPEAHAAPDVIFGAYAYAAQIYCDFSGYTDMAIGLALLMGIVFPQNFNRPYRARSIREFWRRWHRTLSRFLRDYLYIPLGGSRGGRLQHRAEPDDHHAARAASGTVRRGDSSCGEGSTARRSSSSTSCAAARTSCRTGSSGSSRSTSSCLRGSCFARPTCRSQARCSAS